MGAISVTLSAALGDGPRLRREAPEGLLGGIALV